MKTVTLGTTGIEVTELFFGAGAIGGVGSSPTTRGLGMQTDEALERLDEAAELGIRVIDTAINYGGWESERVVGRWHEERERDDVLLETKVGAAADAGPGSGSRAIDLSSATIARQLSLSKSRLGHIDLVLSHAPDPSTPLEETITAFVAAIDAGEARAYGCSNLDVRDLEALLLTADKASLPRPGWVQNEFSLLSRGDERDLMPLAAGEGIGYTAYSPLAGGILSGRYLDRLDPPARSRLAIAPARHPFNEENLLRVDALGVLAGQLGVSIASLAIGWLLWHPSVTAAIVSPRTTGQWDAVTESLEIEFDDSLAERVGAIFV